MSYEGIRESLIISTCNAWRSTPPCRTAQRRGPHQAVHLGLPRHLPRGLEGSLYVYPDAQGVRHTFRVASSLDSLVLGEAQILGQLKDAFDIALKTKTTSTILNKLIKKSISVAKRVRTETRLARARCPSARGRGAGEKIFGDLTARRSCCSAPARWPSWPPSTC